MIIDPSKIDELSKEELVEAMVKIKSIIEEIEAEKSAINQTLFAKMSDKQELIGEYIVKKISKVDFRCVSLDEARPFGAVKEVTKESVDTKLLKKLFEAGEKIPHKVIEFVQFEEVANED